MRSPRLVAAVSAAVAAAALGAALVAAWGSTDTHNSPNPVDHGAGGPIVADALPVPVAGPGDQQPPAVAVRLTIAAKSNGRPVPDSFLGASTEYGSLSLFERHAAILDRVLSQLRVRGGGPLIVRIGGDSADHTFWDRPARGLPRWGIRLTTNWFRQTGAMLRRVGARLILDLNLATASPQAATQLAVEGERFLPKEDIAGFEVGNEPDLYGKSASLARIARAGVHAAERAHWLTPDGYVRGFEEYERILARIAPGVPLVAPALAFPRFNLRWISALLADPHPGLGVVSAHLYPYTRCVDRSSSQYPTIGRLLSSSGLSLLSKIGRPAVLLARRAGLPLRLTELNSVSCGGVPGVSNTFATALWAPDALFELLRAGVEGVNVHIRQGKINSAFEFNRRGLTAHPLLYGLILFARTLGPHARLVRVHLHASHPLDLDAWAVRLPGGLRVLLIDKGNRSANVRLVLRDTGTATVQRLLAPAVGSVSGVSLDGQRLGRNGRWLGRPAHNTLTPSRHAYEVTVPRFSAALVSIRFRR